MDCELKMVSFEYVFPKLYQNDLLLPHFEIINE